MLSLFLLILLHVHSIENTHRNSWIFNGTSLNNTLSLISNKKYMQTRFHMIHFTSSNSEYEDCISRCGDVFSDQELETCKEVCHTLTTAKSSSCPFENGFATCKSIFTRDFNETFADDLCEVLCPSIPLWALAIILPVVFIIIGIFVIILCCKHSPSSSTQEAYTPASNTDAQQSENDSGAGDNEAELTTTGFTSINNYDAPDEAYPSAYEPQYPPDADSDKQIPEYLPDIPTFEQEQQQFTTNASANNQAQTPSYFSNPTYPSSLEQ